MSLIKLNLDESVSSTSANAMTGVFTKLTKKEFFDLLDDGMPSDLSGPEDIIDFRFISYKEGVARFGMVTKDEDEDIGFNVSGIEIRMEPEFDDDAKYFTDLAKAKQALKTLR
ncbi:hypothetical protein pEaSNUABM35_00193 [Erwinia phage pEa_SNUABM_35]|uniref:Uncharacterized protein n=1 Tax=Erwinia phage pEa_SNUABM_35 TaxID=2869557 RepID=A0AAE7XQQ5_9CAUD|nr:hypothetical protein MPK65_gp193 [Erwinia phage pEa_SNUABM_35]QZE60110.1 hypothetical protein pEaSNUABM35_00193 [Erwinia phage pEa_SNUABM_35]QZE60446.1 hypothetical protein pEaSNUABM36_00193 [Erwinia phage pEa_SNUABM_36]